VDQVRHRPPYQFVKEPGGGVRCPVGAPGQEQRRGAADGLGAAPAPYQFV
jgi:hypothetical protein